MLVLSRVGSLAPQQAELGSGREEAAQLQT